MDDNPHTTMTSRRRHRFSVNVWVGILDGQLLGPVVLPNRLTCAVHHCFWWMIYQYSWNMYIFINDSHFLGIVPHKLNQSFGKQWTWRGDPVNWPARSPDLNPLDFWLQGHKVVGVLQRQVETACQEIRVKPGVCDEELKIMLNCMGTT